MPKASDKKQARPADDSSGASLSDTTTTAEASSPPPAGESATPVLDPARHAAARAVGIGYDEVFAFRDYGDHYIVVTVAGQKQWGEK